MSAFLPWLPLGLLDVIEHDLKRSLDDLREVTVQDHSGALGPARLSMGAPIALSTRTYKLVFQNDALHGGHPEVYQYQPVAFFPMLIKDYEDVLHPNAWINRLIMDREEPLPDYSLLPNAQKIVAKILQGDSELFFFFAGELYPEEEEEALVPLLKMELFACTLTPQQICTAAYRARVFLAQDEIRRVRQKLIDHAGKEPE